MDDKNKVLEELNCSSKYSQTRIEKNIFVKFEATQFSEKECLCLKLREEKDKIGN